MNKQKSYSHIGFWYMVPCADDEQRKEGYFDFFVFVNHVVLLPKVINRLDEYFAKTDSVEVLGYEKTLIPRNASVIHFNITLDANCSIILDQIEEYCEPLYHR